MKMISRRSLLKGAVGVGAAVAVGGLRAAPAAADTPVWTISANGWPLELAFFRRLRGGIRPDLGPVSPTGGFILNVRDVGSTAWQPTLGFERFETGISFCRVLLHPDLSLERVQIYRMNQLGPNGPKGYWFEVIAVPNGNGTVSYQRGPQYPWEVTSGWSATGSPWTITPDWEKRWLIARQHGQKLTDWSVYSDQTYLTGTMVNFGEYHWYDASGLRQTWMVSNQGGLPDEAHVIGWTPTNYSKYGLVGFDGSWRNTCWRRPLRFIRALDSEFRKFEYHEAWDNVDSWTNGSTSGSVHWYSDTAGYVAPGSQGGEAMWWRDGLGLRFDTARIPPWGTDYGVPYFWRTNVYRDNGLLTNLGDSALYDRNQLP